MESRQLLATFLVTNTADSGAGSLRAAMLQANARPGPDNVNFNIPASTAPNLDVPVSGFDPISQTWTIALQSALPSITDQLTIDGYTQANFGGVNLSGVTALGSHTYSGWFVGTGLETALPFLGNNWFARIEYRYASYRNANTPALLASGAVVDIISFQPRVETLRTEIVYRF